MVGMAHPGGTWLVLVRDVSRTVRVRGVPRPTAALVLDVDTGFVRGIAVDEDDKGALAQAFATALTKKAGPLPPSPPDAVLCGPAIAGPVETALRAAIRSEPLPPIREVRPGLEAEDIFDSFIGHMAGRSQPEEPPMPEDWQVLFDQALRVGQEQPWARWTDEVDLAVEITVAGTTTEVAAVVMGASGIERGLVLYPGRNRPAHLEDRRHGEPAATPAGTLACMLDPASELPDDLVAKALRYGWPQDAELFPAFLALAPGAGADVSRRDAWILACAMAAVLAHDARGPVLAQAGSETTTGTAPLASGRSARFSIRQQQPGEGVETPRLQVHRVGNSLVPEGTPVVLGHLSWDAMPALRKRARIYRPAPQDAPEPTGGEAPLVVIVTKSRLGEQLAANVAALDPFAVGIVEDGDDAVVVLAGANGAELLMVVATDSSALAAFRRRLRGSKGRHVLMVTDEATDHGEETVYGLFECHGDTPPSQTRRTSPRPKARPKAQPKRRR